LPSGNVQTAGILCFAQDDKLGRLRRPRSKGAAPISEFGFKDVGSTARPGEAEEPEVSFTESMQFFQRPAKMEMQRRIEEGRAGQGLSLLEPASAENAPQDSGGL